MNEKIGGAEGTKLDDDFVEMEKVCALNIRDFVNKLYPLFNTFTFTENGRYLRVG